MQIRSPANMLWQGRHSEGRVDGGVYTHASYMIEIRCPVDMICLGRDGEVGEGGGEEGEEGEGEEESHFGIWGLGGRSTSSCLGDYEKDCGFSREMQCSTE